MKANSFNSFKYLVGNFFSFKNKREVKVFFIYKERYNVILPLMIKKFNFHKDDQYYINEAKKIVEGMIKDASLGKYAVRYIEEENRKHRFLFLWIPLSCALALAGIGVGTYAAIHPMQVVYNVAFNVSGVDISNPIAVKDKDYKTTLTVINPEEYFALPSTLTSITSGGEAITDYTYISHDFTADLFIPKESIKGDIAIDLSLVKLTSLCFTSQQDGSTIGYSITGSLPGIQIQTSIVDSTEELDWTDWDGDTITLNDGDFRYIRNKVNTLSGSSYHLNFAMTGKIAASGNVNSMINYQKTLGNRTFYYLFNGCASLTSAPALPSTSLEGGEYCYEGMFGECTSLISAPALPAKTLETYCYNHMFNGCTSLVSAPMLPAETLADHCYNGMFYNCTSLISTPNELPATNLADNCYEDMFNGCTSLTSIPEELPATILKDCCYYRMFNDCSSLTLAPKLPATTLADHCCYSMFNGCTSLTSAPDELPATNMVENCYQSMFNGCTSLTSAPALPATTLANYCYYGMFDGCTSLKVNENGTGTKIFKCPDTAGLTNPVLYMFDNTAGTFTEGTPTVGKTYYWYK